MALGRQIGRRGDAQRLDDAAVSRQRMAGDVEAEHLLLEREALVGLPFRRDLGRRASPDGRRRQDLEEGPLPFGAVTLLALAALECRVGGGEEMRTREAERVEGACLDETLHHTPVDEPEVDPRAEVLQRLERPLAATRLQDRLHRGLADVLDRGQAEANRVAGDAELHGRHVHVGRHDLDPHRPTLFDVLHDLVGVPHFGGQQRGHELDGIVRLEVRGLVRDEPVGRGVRFVESVARELLHQLPDALGLRGGGVALAAARDELLALLGHELAVLLAHGAAEDVRLAHGEARHLGGDLHDLLLVHHDPVRLPRELLHRGVLVRDLGPAVLALDEVGNELHRAGSVERDHGDEVFELLGPETAERVAHPGRLELEHAERLRLGEHLVRFLVVERQAIEVEVEPAGLLDQRHRVGEHGERAESEEVHLQEPELLDRSHRVAGDQLRTLGVLVERDVFLERLVGDHDSRGVHRGVAGASLERAGDLPQLAHVGLAAHHLGQGQRLLVRVVERDVQREVRHQLGDPVDVGVRHAEHAPDVADRRLRAERPEGDDVGDPVAAVAFRHVADDLVAAVVREIDVHIGHRDPFRVQESLEQEPVPDRVDVGDAQTVGGQRAGGRAASGPDRDPLLARVADEVPHDQEVAREPHLLDDGELAGQPGLYGVPGARIPALEPFVGELVQIAVERVLTGDDVARQVELVEVECEVAALGHRQGVATGLR